jgi:hypothetical protein
MEDSNKPLTDSEKLRNWLDFSVPRGEYNNIKARLVSECLVSVFTFNNWLYGKCRIPNAGKRDINRVTMEITGTEIFTNSQTGGQSEGVSGLSSGEAI